MEGLSSKVQIIDLSGFCAKELTPWGNNSHSLILFLFLHTLAEKESLDFTKEIIYDLTTYMNPNK